MVLSKLQTPDSKDYDPPVGSTQLVLSKASSWAEVKSLLIHEKNIPLSLLESALYHGGLYVDQKRLVHERSLLFSEGSLIEVYYFLREPKPFSPPPVLFENKHVLAVNKPAWLPVQATKVSCHYSLETLLKQQTQNKQLMAAHRLDRQTSGIVLFGKTRQGVSGLMTCFQKQQVKKKYLALAGLKPDWQSTEVSGFMQRDYKRLPQVFFRLVSHELPKARSSHTCFRHLDFQKGISLIEAVPVTGRTHQIRVHLASLGLPVLGDKLYGGSVHVGDVLVPRIQLHAFEICLPKEIVMTDKTVIRAGFPHDFLWTDPIKDF